MLTRWNTGFGDFDEIFSTLHDLREHVDRAFSGDPSGATWAGTWPRSNIIDAGSSIIVTAEVPGLTDKDIELTLNQDVLSIRGERMPEIPQGYSAHRKERPVLQFARSFALPCKVDPERASASVKNGVLTVTLEKAREAMPRQITVQSN